MDSKRYIGGHEVYLTTEKIKAIRVVLGLNSDLRVKLKHYDLYAMTEFIIEHRHTLFPFNTKLRDIPDDVDLRDKWYKAMTREALAVLGR